MDDKSTDNSIDIIKNFQKQDTRIILLQNSENKGVSWTRDRAIRYSKSKYITTLDSDDFYLDPFKIETELKTIEKFENPEKDICAYSCALLVNEAGEPQDLLNKHIRQGNLFTDILTRRIDIPRDFMFARRIYFEVGGYNLGMNFYEDWDLKIRISMKTGFYYTGRVGTAYRMHNTGLSSVEPIKHLIMMNTIFRKYNSEIKFIKRYPFTIKNQILINMMSLKTWLKKYRSET